MWLTAKFVSGFEIKGGFGGSALVALVFGLLDFLLRHFLFVVIGIGTLGIGFLLEPLAQWLITTLLLVLTDKLSDTLTIRSFSRAALAAFVISVLAMVFRRVYAGLAA